MPKKIRSRNKKVNCIEEGKRQVLPSEKSEAVNGNHETKNYAKKDELQNENEHVAEQIGRGDKECDKAEESEETMDAKLQVEMINATFTLFRSGKTKSHNEMTLDNTTFDNINLKLQCTETNIAETQSETNSQTSKDSMKSNDKEAIILKLAEYTGESREEAELQLQALWNDMDLIRKQPESSEYQTPKKRTIHGLKDRVQQLKSSNSTVQKTNTDEAIRLGDIKLEMETLIKLLKDLPGEVECMISEFALKNLTDVNVLREAVKTDVSMSSLKQDILLEKGKFEMLQHENRTLQDELDSEETILSFVHGKLQEHEHWTSSFCEEQTAKEKKMEEKLKALENLHSGMIKRAKKVGAENEERLADYRSYEAKYREEYDSISFFINRNDCMEILKKCEQMKEVILMRIKSLDDALCMLESVSVGVLGNVDMRLYALKDELQSQKAKLAVLLDEKRDLIDDNCAMMMEVWCMDTWALLLRKEAEILGLKLANVKNLEKLAGFVDDLDKKTGGLEKMIKKKEEEMLIVSKTKRAAIQELCLMSENYQKRSNILCRLLLHL